MERRDESGVVAFVERLGAFLETSGMPRIASRAFAAILIDEDARMTAAELSAGWRSVRRQSRTP